MAHGMDDDLGFGRLVENEMGIRQCRHAPDGRVVCAGANMGIHQKKVDDRLNARLNTGAP